MVEKVLAVSDAVDFFFLFWVKEWHQADLARSLIHYFLHFSDVVFLLDMYRLKLLNYFLRCGFSVHCSVFVGDCRVCFENIGCSFDYIFLTGTGLVDSETCSKC